MCDRDHSAEDQERYEALGLITRKQFGVLLAAGVAMLLPKVANAVTVTESDVTIRLRTAPRTATSSIHLPAPRPACWCGRISLGCGRHSGRWVSGSRSQAIRCWW